MGFVFWLGFYIAASIGLVSNLHFVFPEVEAFPLRDTEVEFPE